MRWLRDRQVGLVNHQVGIAVADGVVAQPRAGGIGRHQCVGIGACVQGAGHGARAIVGEAHARDRIGAEQARGCDAARCTQGLCCAVGGGYRQRADRERRTRDRQCTVGFGQRVVAGQGRAPGHAQVIGIGAACHRGACSVTCDGDALGALEAGDGGCAVALRCTGVNLAAGGTGDRQRRWCNRERCTHITDGVVAQARAHGCGGRAVVGAGVDHCGGRIGDDRARAHHRTGAEGVARAGDAVARAHAVHRGDQTRGGHQTAKLGHPVVGEVGAIRRDGQRRRGDAQTHRVGAHSTTDQHARCHQNAHRAGEVVAVVGVVRARGGHRVDLLARQHAIACARAGDAVQEVGQRNVKVGAIDAEDDLGHARIGAQASAVGRGRGEVLSQCVFQRAGCRHTAQCVGRVGRAVNLGQVATQHHLVAGLHAELDGRPSRRACLGVGAGQVGDVDRRVGQTGRSDVGVSVSLRKHRVVERQSAQCAVQVGQGGGIGVARARLTCIKVNVTVGRRQRVANDPHNLPSGAGAHRQVSARTQHHIARAVVGDLGRGEVAVVGGRQENTTVGVLRDDACGAVQRRGCADGGNLDHASRAGVGDGQGVAVAAASGAQTVGHDVDVALDRVVVDGADASNVHRISARGGGAADVDRVFVGGRGEVSRRSVGQCDGAEQNTCATVGCAGESEAARHRGHVLGIVNASACGACRSCNADVATRFQVGVVLISRTRVIGVGDWPSEADCISARASGHWRTRCRL